MISLFIRRGRPTTAARNFAARIGAAYVTPETAEERTLALIADALAEPAEGREPERR